jgi:cyclic nucleotide gated channel alpha 3
MNKNKRNNLNCTFIFDPNGRFCYWMSFVVSLAFLYNFWIIIYRYSFDEINEYNRFIWFIFDYLADLLYVIDIIFNFRTGFLEDGVLQTDPLRLRHYYMNTTRFYIDCLCLIPLDILYLSIGYYSILRCFRLVKIYRFWMFLDHTERHTNYPNAFRSLTMLHYLFALFHWNTCFINKMKNYFSPEFNLKILNTKLKQTDLTREYLKSFYQSTLIMTLIGVDQYKPQSNAEYLFIILELIASLILFAAIMGHVAYIVANLGAARKEFQSKLDSVKTYMHIRSVPLILQERVIRWFDYLWSNARSTDDNHVLSLLPYKLHAEIAIHVHLDTLKRVEIFQNTEVGFLNELVLRLKPVLYSPGDYICRKGEVGKEMYIVNSGKLQVISEDGSSVLATLKAGSCFGEISVLNLGKFLL